METELLRTFVEVHRMRNFGKAAENLCLTASAVSARIRQLERSLGVELFVRDHHNISLTPAGERLLRHAQGILNSWELAFEDVVLEEEQRRLAVGGVAAFWEVFLNRWFRRVRTDNPQLRLRAEASTSKRVDEKLATGLIDLGFLFEPPQVPDMVIREVMSLPLVLVSSRAGISTEEALNRGYIRVEWGTAFTSLHEQHFPHRPTAAVRANTGRIALELMRCCGGTAYLPRALVSGDLDARTLFLVESAPEIPMTAYAAYPARGELRGLIEPLVELFDSELPE